MKKRLINYKKLRPDLREQIVDALDKIAEQDFVEDIELERLIVGHHKDPHVKAEREGGIIKASIYLRDSRFGRGIGCVARVSYKYSGLKYLADSVAKKIRSTGARENYSLRPDLALA